MAAMDAALGHLVHDTDWTTPCSTMFFCFGCDSLVCPHCRERQGHRQSHHPDRAGDPLRVEIISGGRLAVDASTFVGCGYGLTGIQRVLWRGRKYILILTVEEGDPRCYMPCQGCQLHIKTGSSWCSLQCKCHNAQGGRLRPVAQHFAALAAQGQFGVPVHVKNRFCMICSLAFASASCPSHPPHGHPQNPLYPAAAPGDIKRIVRFDGWVAIPHGELPDHVVQDVQVVHGPDDIMAYPIHPREHPQPPPPAGVGHPHACDRPGCLEMFFGMAHFCSLRCRHH